MAAHRQTNEPNPGDVLWSGLVRRRKWRVVCSSVLHSKGESEPDHLGMMTAAGTYWRLRFEVESNDTFELTWSPKDRIIFGSLNSWPKPAKAQLKTALIQWANES